MSAFTSLHQQLTDAGIPINGVSQTAVDYKPEATAPQRTQGDAILAGFDWSDVAEAVRQVARNRVDALPLFLNSTPLGQILRAEALVLIDDINLLRGWITSFKLAVSLSTSLADLKTRVAALDPMPDRTAVQAKNAIVAKAGNTAADA
jgi:hypothetical protein